ncbi:MAG: ABC transporter ATP-binding protein/permease [Halioglobus sp.]|nr:ABC transporter ATP-binding protein/permease [Halioglobus sp.]
MSYQPFPFTVAWKYFVRSVRNFANSGVGGHARWMFVGLIAFLFAINGMTVVNSYVGRDFMTAIADRDRTAFIRQAVLYIAVFAVSTLISVSIRFLEERLALLWREYLTRRLLDRYLADGSYYDLDTSRTLANPDQRIAEDARSFTGTTLSFVLMMLNSSFTVVAFSGVLWTISPLLFMVAVLYAAGGSLLTVLLGRPLVGLNYEQFDREANFRSGLIHVRENAEAVLVAGREAGLLQRLHGSLTSLVDNFRRIVSINRNLGFFTTGYNWLIQIIPVMIIAPAFMDGRVEFGVVTQSAMAFSTLVAAFSLIVTQFQSISSFAAVVSRLSSLVEAVDASKYCGQCTLDIIEEEGRLAYEELTLRSPDDGRLLIDKLSLEIPHGGRFLIQSEDEAVLLALFRATAGIEVSGEGRLVRPGAQNLGLLAQRPYLPPGTLREALVSPIPCMEHVVSDLQLTDQLAEWGLEGILLRTDGLHTEQDWESVLSLGEQQLLACLHVILAAPGFVILDRPSTALGIERTRDVLNRFAEASIGYVKLGHAKGQDDLYDAIVDVRADGSWSVAGRPLPPAGTAQ